MFTPQEVSEKTFPKSPRFSEGYQMAAVDEFLDALTVDYTTLFNDNGALKTKLKVLAEKVEEYRSTEDSMRATLVTAQKMASKLLQEAQEEKDNLVAEARKNAAAEIAQLDAETAQARRKLALAQKELADFIAQSKALISKQQAFLESLPELEAEQPKEAAIENTVTDIGEEIRRTFTEEAPVQKEEPEVKQPEVVPPMGRAIPGDFEMSLDELKFGRNYNGGNEK